MIIDLCSISRLAPLALIACIGCSNQLPGPYRNAQGDGGQPGDGGAPTSLLITPEGPQEFTVTVGAPTRFSWQAFLIDNMSGARTDVTSLCVWEVKPLHSQRTPLGRIDRGNFEAERETAGSGEVSARYMGQSASVPIKLRLESIHLSTSDDASAPPATAPVRFSGLLSEVKTPEVVYPPASAGAEVILPQNLSQLTIQWVARGGTDLHEITLRGALLNLRIYTTSTRRLTLTDAEYNLLTDAGLEGPVSVQVRGGNQSGDGSYGEAAPIRLRVTSQLVGGTYYFATASDKGPQGIWRYNWLTPGSQAEAYATQASPQTGYRCAGCHRVSRNGQRLSLATDRDALSIGGVINILDGRATQITGDTRWMFSAMNVNGERMLTTGNKLLRLLKAENGVVEQELPPGVMGESIPTMPALSADEQRIVFVHGKPVAGKSEVQIQNGSIVQMKAQGGRFNMPPSVLVPAQTSTENNYYPALSPDGKWVLFNRAPSESSFNNVRADLYVVDVEGSLPPIPLIRANTEFYAANANVLANRTNSYPQWAPIPVMLDGKPLYFFTFSSRRDYGIEITHLGTSPAAGMTQILDKSPGTGIRQGGWNHQLWLSSFDPEKAARGEDPSSPALRLPFQGPSASNHTATWTQVIIGPVLK